MPTYLCHGFRWHRLSIRVFTIIHDLEDAAPDWVMGFDTTSLILDQLYENFDFLPELTVVEEPANQQAEEAQLKSEEAKAQGKQKEPIHQDEDMSLPPPRFSVSDDAALMHQWSAVKLLEEHDMTETAVATRPYAYVADHVVRIDLSADVAAEMAKYEAKAKEGGGEGETPWFVQLRDKMQPGEDIKWYVVVCDDEERAAPEEESEDEVMEGVEEVPTPMETDSLPHRPASRSAAAVPSQETRDTAGSVTNQSEEPATSREPEQQPGQASTGGQNGHAKKAQVKGKQSISKGLRRLLGKKDKS